MIIGLVIGLILGIGIDLIGAKDAVYLEQGRQEISAWYALVGSGFIRLVQLLAVPVVFLSIIKVVTDVDADRIKNLTGKTFAVLLGTTAISAAVGIFVVNLYNLQGANFAANLSEEQVDRMSNIAAQSFPEFFLNLIPNNIINVMGNNGQVVSTVIVGALFASAIRFLSIKKPDEVKPFIDLLDSLRTTVNSVLINVIKLMPYGVIALVANAIISNGVNTILDMAGLSSPFTPVF